MTEVKENNTRVVAVEYAGVGTVPHFVIELNGEYNYIPIKTGVTRIDKLTNI